MPDGASPSAGTSHPDGASHPDGTLRADGTSPSDGTLRADGLPGARSDATSIESASLYGSDVDVRRVLTQCATWFIVGLGNSPDRAAYAVARVLQQHGKRIVPIHPRAETVHGEPGYSTIEDAVAAVGVPDVVDCFVRSDRAGAYADQAVAVGAKAVWFQLDVIDESAAQRVLDAGVVMVMDRCPAIELRRLG